MSCYLQAYRESIRTKKDDFAEEDQEPSAEELFADMAPTVIRQKKVSSENNTSKVVDGQKEGRHLRKVVDGLNEGHHLGSMVDFVVDFVRGF